MNSGTHFIGFAVPLFEIIDTWWVGTTKTYTFGLYTFHWHHWFAVKLFPMLCAGYREFRCFALAPPSLETFGIFLHSRVLYPHIYVFVTDIAQIRCI